MNSKYIFLDIDGTIAMPGEEISPELRSAIKEAQKNGHKFFVNTGRSEKDLPEYLKDVGFDGFIFSAGGKIIVNDQIIYEETLTENELIDITDLMDSLDLHYILEGEKENYTNRDSFFDFSSIDPNLLSSESRKVLLADSESDVHAPIPISERENDDVFKVTFRIYDTENGEQIVNNIKTNLDKSFRACFFDNVFPGIPFILGEINPAKIDKGKAIQKVCEYYGADIKDSISFGDSTNDSEMIVAAGLGVAMGNSAPEVKELADIVCETVEENGIVNELKRQGLIEELNK